jgi:hypothetical protein
VTWPCFRTLDNAIRDVRDRATRKSDREKVDTTKLCWVGGSLRSRGSKGAAVCEMANHLPLEWGVTSMCYRALWYESEQAWRPVRETGFGDPIGDFATVGGKFANR